MAVIKHECSLKLKPRFSELFYYLHVPD